MDEPFKGLDLDTRCRVMDFVISKIENKSVIIITHDMNDIKYFKTCKKLKVNQILFG